jgi:hypothetical protein
MDAAGDIKRPDEGVSLFESWGGSRVASFHGQVCAIIEHVEAISRPRIGPATVRPK